jgi:hypothetical protein
MPTSEGVRATKGRGLHALALLLALIHPSAWKGNSANFAFTEFQEVRRLSALFEAALSLASPLGTHQSPPRSNLPLPIPLPKTPERGAPRHPP